MNITKKVKRITLGILGATILSLGLYACSNEDAITTEQTTITAKGFGDIKIIPGLPGFGLVSPTIGDCMPGPGFCFSSQPDIKPIFGIGRLDNTMIRITMSMNTYQSNKEYLSRGVFEVGVDFSLTREISKELGFESRAIVTKQTAKVVQANDETFYIDLKVKQN